MKLSKSDLNIVIVDDNISSGVDNAKQGPFTLLHCWWLRIATCQLHKVYDCVSVL